MANLRFVKEKQEKQDKKLDELECQLARLENRLESRFKLPDVDPSTLDEMNREAFRLWSLIDARDIPDQESILKRLDDAKDELKKWEEADIKGKLEMGIMSEKYRRHSRLIEREKEYCRGWLGSVIGSARWKISDWEWDRQQEEWKREKDSPEEPPKN